MPIEHNCSLEKKKIGTDSCIESDESRCIIFSRRGVDVKCTGMNPPPERLGVFFILFFYLFLPSFRHILSTFQPLEEQNVWGNEKQKCAMRAERYGDVKTFYYYYDGIGDFSDFLPVFTLTSPALSPISSCGGGVIRH
jgi:hypothetical protein